MPTLVASKVKNRLSSIIDDVAEQHRGYCIVGERNQAILISMDDWSAIQESLYLNSFPGLADSIVAGMKTPVSKCSTELKW